MASLAVPPDGSPGSPTDFALAVKKQTDANESYHVVDDADICLVFSQSPSAELFVSSEVLSRSSVAFAELVSPPPDCQHEQSATTVRVVNVDDVHFGTMKFVCILLHNGLQIEILPSANIEDGAIVLFAMANVAKTYGIVGIFKDSISPALFDSFQQARLAEPINRVDDEEVVISLFMKDAMLAAAAYMLEQEETFTLYTKRMAMDHCAQFSLLEEARYFELVPAFAILGLEDQRNLIREGINEEVHRLATHKCQSCDTTGYDHNLAATIGQKLTPKLKHWPPHYVEEHSIREVLSAISSIDRFSSFKQNPRTLCPKHYNLTYREPEQFKRVAERLGASVYGSCYRCTKSNTSAFDCEHDDDLMKRMSELDPVV